jgi:NSS family neurotransmitter:Na+ symporter
MTDSGTTASGRPRETFASRFGTLMTFIGVAVGLGNVWRFPYMVGKFGGSAFVVVYVIIAVSIGVPALMAEFALGRLSRRGPVGAFEAGRLPFGKFVGWFFFVIVTAATGYYTAVIGWVLYYGLAQLASAAGITIDAAAILPPDRGFVRTSFVLQLACTATVIVGVALVLMRGVRSGIERASKIIMPVLFAILIVLVVRSLTLPGAMRGLYWYILRFDIADVTPTVIVAAMGQAIFSLSLGGTFMVIYGSYLDSRMRLATPAISTVVGDTSVSLLAGLAILPAVFALGLESTSGPSLLFSTLPKVFAALPAGGIFGFLFFAGLFGAAYLSDVAAFEALVAGVTDNTRMPRRRAVWMMAAAVFLLSIPPTINIGIFVPWDLTFGSGMQTLGSLLAVLTIGWCVDRSTALAELSSRGEHPVPTWLLYWIRFGIPTAILTVGIWWLLTSVVGITWLQA